MTKVWQELRHFLRQSYRNQRTVRKFELRRRLEQAVLINQTT